MQKNVEEEEEEVFVLMNNTMVKMIKMMKKCFEKKAQQSMVLKEEYYKEYCIVCIFFTYACICVSLRTYSPVLDRRPFRNGTIFSSARELENMFSVSIHGV